MKRLGYTRYVAQGGDWGSGIVQAMGRQGSAGLLGIHTNLPAAVPDEVGPALGGGPVPAGISEKERVAVEGLRAFLASGNLVFKFDPSIHQATGRGAIAEIPYLWESLEHITCPTLPIWTLEIPGISECLARRVRVEHRRMDGANRGSVGCRP